MKADIHPNYDDIKVTCSCGNEFTTRSTLGEDLQAEDRRYRWTRRQVPQEVRYGLGPTVRCGRLASTYNDFPLSPDLRGLCYA